MKKFFSIILALCIALTAFTFTTTAASDEFTVAVESCNAARGESVTVNVLYKNNPGINYMKLKLHYDDECLTLTSVTSTLPGFVSGQNITANPHISVFAQAGNIKSDGAVISYTFDVDENAPLDTPTTISAEIIECYNENDDVITPATEEGTVSFYCNHSYKCTVITPATYNHAGVNRLICSKCGAYYDEDAARLVPDENTPTIELVPESSVASSDTFNVNINIKNNPGFNYIMLKIAYDSSVLTLNSVKSCSNYIGATQTSQYIDANPYIIVLANAGNFYGDGAVFTVSFTVADNIPDGVTILSVTDVEAYDENDNDVLLYTPDANVNIVNFIYGDCDNDKVITGTDVTLLMKYLSEWNVEVNRKAADCNGDGVINGKDATLFKKYLADWDVEFGQYAK